MHSYLRTIGLTKYKTRKQLESVYRSCLSAPSRKIVTTVSVDTSLLQFEKDFDKNLGFALVGEVEASGSCSIEHYFPYLKGDHFLEFENIQIEKQTDKESYAGVCEDYRLGMTIIFYVINIADYAKSKWLNYSNRHLTQVKFSGLCTEGAILLGTGNNKSQKQKESEGRKRRYNLLAEAREGNTEAIESLTLDEMDTYTSINNRMQTEDLFTVVDTSFMPCGIECDHYLVVGNILDFQLMTNQLTDEKIYNLLIEANDLTMNVAINQSDLTGEPAVGRRFRGEIWLQGVVRI